MKYGMRRTAGIRWDRWHRMVVLQSLRMMVLSGVVRRAEVDPPQYLDDHEDIETDPEAAFSISLPPVNLDKQGWFTRFFRRRAGLLFTQARHTT